MKGINKKYLKDISLQDHLFKWPWEHYVFDNFLNVSTLKKTLDFIKNNDYVFQIDNNDSQKLQYSLNYDNLLNEIFISKWFKNFLENITNEKVDFFEKNFIQIRRMDASSPIFSKHVDIIDNQKSFVIILYLSNNWTKENQGELLLYKTFKTPKKNAKVISPILNRLIILPTNKAHWHSVERVKNFVRISIIQEWITI